ncbi:MAG TPA: cytochrome d ubiquinol oxidase subunit II [Pseudonocardiaceae bacterium]
MNPSAEAVAVGVVLIVVMAAYALFAGADFGGGIWDLLAGGTVRGAKPRAAIDASVTPVWEGNHVWLIFGLVLSWTAFAPLFAAVMTALFVPLALSLLGIFLRGVGFAFRHEAARLRTRRLFGAIFAASSLIAPFFLGTVIGAVATGRVPVRPAGSVTAAWTTPTALMTGCLFVAACAYVGAVYLIADSDRRGQPDLVRYFSRRAVVAGLATGVLAGINMLLLRTSAPYVFGRLLGASLPLVVVSVAAGITALVLVLLGHTRTPRVAAGIAVATVVFGWGWAQYPWLIPGRLSLAEGSAPGGTLTAELVVAVLAGIIVVPSFGYLYWLQQHGRLEDGDH